MISSLCTDQCALQQVTGFHIKKKSRIKVLSIYSDLKMQMFGCSPPCTSRQGNRLPAFTVSPAATIFFEL